MSAEAGTEVSAEDTSAVRGRRLSVGLALLVVALAAVFVGRTAMGSDGVRADGPEAGFARDMSTHHAQAVRMAFTVRDASTDKSLRVLAYDIITTQSAQIGMMSAWLDGWKAPHADPAGPMRWMSGHGHGGKATGPAAPMPGMATREQLATLESARGQDAEVRFLRLMIAHHQGGVTMAQAALARTGEPEVRRLAESIVAGQQSEITLMTSMLAERHAVP